jgi:dTDP-4-dehydrorhamnose 3,5-epimerase
MRVEGAQFDERTFFNDDRGLFLEVEKWDVPNQQKHYFKQLNYSVSKFGVIRGMHIMTEDPQGKLIVCLRGEILDVVHDMRKNSETFGATDYRILQPGQSLFCPPGTAHGFQCLTKTCEIVYLCTSHYEPKNDIGFRWEDAQAPWQKDIAIVSKKDEQLPRLVDLLRVYQWTNN